MRNFNTDAVQPEAEIEPGYYPERDEGPEHSADEYRSLLTEDGDTLRAEHLDGASDRVGSTFNGHIATDIKSGEEDDWLDLNCTGQHGRPETVDLSRFVIYESGNTPSAAPQEEADVNPEPYGVTHMKDIEPK